MGKAFEYLNMLPGDTAEEVLQLRDRIFNAGAPDLPVGTPQPPFPYEAEVPQPDASVSGRACILFFTCQAEASQPGAALSGKPLILQVPVRFGWCSSELPSQNHQRLLFIVKQRCHSLALPSQVSTPVLLWHLWLVLLRRACMHQSPSLQRTSSRMPSVSGRLLGAACHSAWPLLHATGTGRRHLTCPWAATDCGPVWSVCRRWFGCKQLAHALNEVHD